MGFFVLKRITLLNNFSNRILRWAEKFKSLHFKNNSKPQTGYFGTDNAFPLLWGKSLLQFHLRCPRKGIFTSLFSQSLVPSTLNC